MTAMQTTSRRTDVAAALAEAGAAGVSGERLAAALGISRVAVSKHVAALRELGYRIASAPRAGYRLEAAPDLCIPEEVAPRLTDPLWVACVGGLELSSTNDEAKRRARAGASEGSVVVAARQTGGRGRFERSWQSPHGGAYVSAVLRPPADPAAVAPLSLVVALGAARGLGSLGVTAGVKWPNDLHADGRKLAGVLLEMAAEADRVEWVVAGIGVNVADPGLPGSAWAREQAPDVPVADVAARVLDGIAGVYRTWIDVGFAPLRAEYESRLTLTGSTVAVRDAGGRVLGEGEVRGIDGTGGLLVATASGTVVVHAGEVTLRQ